MHEAIGLGLLIYLVSYAFGSTAARVLVGFGLLVGAALLLWIAIRVVTGVA